MTMPQAIKVRRFVPPAIMCLMAVASVYGSVVSRTGEQIQVEAIDMANPAAIRQALAFNPLDPMQSSQSPAMQDVTPAEAGAWPVMKEVRLAKANSSAMGKLIAGMGKNWAIGKSSRFAELSEYVKSTRTFKPKALGKNAKVGAMKWPLGIIMTLGWPALAAIGIGTTVVEVIPIAAGSFADSFVGSDLDRSKSSP